MDLLKTKRVPDDFATDVLDILRKMSFTNLLHLKVMGSGSLKSQLYAGDYDGYEQVPIRSVSSAVHKFQSIVRSLMETPLTYIGDIKSGAVEDWKVFDEDEDYNAVRIKKRVEDLHKRGVINNQEYKDAMAMLKPKPTPYQVLEIRRDLRFHIVRWTPKEVLAGHKYLHDQRKYTLEEAFKSPAITKLDVISWVQGNRFTDFSVIYEFILNGKVLNKGVKNVEVALKENILQLYHEKDYFKMAKRMFALAKFKGAYPMLTALSPLFNGDLGRIYMVYGDLGTLEYMIENYKSLPKIKIKFEIDQFKNRLANVVLPKYLANEPEFNDIIEKLLNIQHYTQNSAQMLRLVRQLKDRLKDLLSQYSYIYLKEKHLIPPPTSFLKGGAKDAFEGVSGDTKEYLTSVGKKEKGKKSHQQEHAQFYTPKVLKDKAFEGIDVPKDAPVLEPTYGSGEFLEALLERGYSNITGVEYDPMVFNKFREKWESKGVRVFNGDYLMAKFDRKFKLVVGNPPYFLMKGKNAMTEEQKAFYRPYFKGVPDIYVIATIKGIMDLDEGGILSFVIPTSLLTSPQHQLARNYIHKECSILDIYIHPDRKAFAGADVEVMVFKVQKSATPNNRFIKTIGKNIIFARDEVGGVEEEGLERIKDLVQFKVGPTDISKITDKSNLSGERTAETLPIIYGENINSNILLVDGAIKKGRMQYLKKTYEPKKQIEAPFIVIKRTIGTGKSKAFKCAMVSEGTFYCENHTFYGKGTPHNLGKVYRVLSDPDYQKQWLKDVNGLAISGTFINDIPIPKAS